MDTSPSNSTRSPWIWLMLVIGIAIVAAAWWLANPANPPNPQGQPIARQTDLKTKKLTRDDSLKLVDLRNQAIAHLENHEFAKTEAALAQMFPMIPDDPFVSRNRLISWQLALSKIDKKQHPDEFAVATTNAKEAIPRAKRVEPESYVPLVIAARVAERLEETPQALTDLRDAVQKSPDAVGPAYDLFVMLQNNHAEGAATEAIDALRRVYRKEPQNLSVLKEWLPRVAQQHGPEFVETLKQAQETIGPFAEIIKNHSRQDILAILNSAIKAAEQQNWQLAERSTIMVRNLILPESARDMRYVALNSLEYLVPEFSEETLARLDLPPAPHPVSRPVHFLAPDDTTKWPEVMECHDMSVTDFDLDGKNDLIVLQSRRVTVWGRSGEEPAWTIAADIESEGAYSGLLAQDLDDDIDQAVVAKNTDQKKVHPQSHDSYSVHLAPTADPDLILFGPSGLKLFENKRDANTDGRSLIAKSGGDAFDRVRDVTAATLADIDSDGDLDLVAATNDGVRIFSNRGNLTFVEISSNSSLPPPGTQILAMAIVDWDKDTGIDVIVATATGVGLLENVRHGRMRYRDLKDFAALNGCTSLSIADFDGDASWDLLGSGPSGANVAITNRSVAGVVTLRKMVSLVTDPVLTSRTADFDNDAALDVLLVQDSGVTLWRNEGASQFSPSPRPADDWLKSAKLASVSDLDRDGDIDLVVVDSQSVRGYSNQNQETDNPDHGWLETHLIAEHVKPLEQNHERRTNHVNRGGMLEIKAGDRYQASIVTNQVTHFGLGAQRHADVARILWTNGIPTNVVDPPSDLAISIEQKLGGSCPYLYTWNGDQFVFATDLLWNAPLGLKFAENVIAPWREWEYLKIDGQQLKAKQDTYPLRISAELWEAEYFDQLKLIAIDHPEGTEIYTNEKVGPAEIAQQRIHTVQSPRKPVVAKDTRGRDVLSQVLSRDGNYTKTFDIRLAQGMTEEHFLELDLGEFPAAKNVTLFLTGWMYPGSTSLRVGLSQNPDMPQSRPPAIYVPDQNGEWREARSYMGFPGGKTKTIAVDISDLMTTDDHRLRIVSTMELFWDAVFFTVDEPEIEIRQTELKLVSAELVDRGGVSARSWPKSGHGPDQFFYSQLVPGEAWPPMLGNFTRYGDVLPLLTTRDDHLVVLGSGDEMRLSFAVPSEPLAEGWVRDFVIYSVGWDKDADQNTVYGDVVEPLPFEAMTVYGEPRPVDDAYAEYLRAYQTRQQSPSRFWNAVLRSSRN